MKLFGLWVLPFPKKKGAFDKWEKQDDVQAKSRKDAISKIGKEYKIGTWKLRLETE